MTDQTTTPPDDVLADLIARCPEHGQATETWPECRCDAARKTVELMAAVDPEPAEAREREIDTELREARAEITALREGIGRVRDEFERCRTAVCEALGRHMGLGWPAIVERVELAVAGASEREVLLTGARDALSEAGQTGAHGDDWPAVAPAIRALGAALAEARAEKQRQIDAKMGVSGEWGNALADLEQERAAHEEHRRQLCAPLRLRRDADWTAVTAAAERAVRAVNILADAERNQQSAEAARDRVRQMAGAWEQRFPDTIRTATAVEAIRTALDGGSEQAAPGPCCVCGDPIQLMDDNDPGCWIHSPGSNTPCLDARPAEATVAVTLPACLDIRSAQKRAWANKLTKGFNTTDVSLEFGLLTAEIGEAFTAWRKSLPDFGEELADIFLYLVALAEMTDVDLADAVTHKMEKNARREYVRNEHGVPIRVGRDEDGGEGA